MLLQRFVYSVFCLAVLFPLPVGISAQSISYPKEVKSIYQEADRQARLSLDPRLLIGVPAGPQVVEEVAAVQQIGGVPMVIPMSSDAEVLAHAVDVLDGLVLTGGVMAADTFSVLLNKLAADRNIPIMMPHPQDLVRQLDSCQWRIHDYPSTYQQLLTKARLYNRAKRLHQRIFTIDSHGDLAEEYRHGASVGRRQTNQISIQKMNEGKLDAEFIVNFQKQGLLTAEGLAQGVQKGKQIMAQIHADVENYKDFCGIARTPDEALELKKQGKKAFFIGLENGHAIGDDLKNIRWYSDQGVSYITLCWMKDNAICHSSNVKDTTNQTHLGLTPFGKKVVKEMNRQGVLIDLSHASQQTFWDCIALSKAPVIFSHSGCMARFVHDRNVTDKEIKALARNGGVLQIYAVWNFQCSNMHRACVNHMVEDIDHAVKVGGIDHVGIGIDLDGGGGYRGIMGQNDAINITMGLMEKGYTDGDIGKIWGGNLMRVMNDALRRRL